ncbi:hypothetical protein E1I21_11175 [Microbacterium oleivorans]|jgi:hypothetical protein|uniref:Uncharacterized protein n=1 Tax=Microbacterium oleivorans TaxID=273677 RepID=A0A031FX00_9MICO|nr:hypothetical protein [Microbacterium oleivorans]EZP29113.1 hypothetical protein BW34_00630 [Microbacterium oleivorans]THE06589.1 hypothetical protein E1I21_11175 [Microbacterium oleivorans]
MSESVPPYPPQQQPGYPYGTPPAPAGAGRGLAITAVIIAAVPVLLGGIWPMITIQLYRMASDPALLGIANGFSAVFTCALALVALILGLVAVKRDAAVRLLGGIAIGLAAATVVGTVLGFLSSTIASGLF